MTPQRGPDAVSWAMDDDLERAARKHRLQQRHGAIRVGVSERTTEINSGTKAGESEDEKAQQRQRLQEEQKKAALDVSPANADAMPSSSSRPATAEQAQVPEKAVCAIHFHVRL
ncbi:Dml, partial [Symbiodinium sp. CCMP2456]